LATILTPANRHDSTQLIPLVNTIPAIRGKDGAPLSTPGCVVADRGYDCKAHRMTLSYRNIATRIARRRMPTAASLAKIAGPSNEP